MSSSRKRKAGTTTAPRLFVYKSNSYTKPTIYERTLGIASEVWRQLKDIGVDAKPIKKWTVKQRETFVIVLNKYISISHVGDNDDSGSISDLLADVNSYLLEGNDEEMREWLDPNYIVVEWSNALLLPGPLPDLTAIVPPLSPTIALIATGQPQCYIVPSLTAGNFLLGILVQRWPGARGFCFSSATPVELRG